MKLNIVLCLLTLFNYGQTSKILFIIGLGSHSHRASMEPLAHKLVEKGHQVTFFTPIPPTEPNPKFSEFSTSELSDFYKNIIMVVGNVYFPGRYANKHHCTLPNPLIFAEFEQLSCSLMFKSPEFKPWLERSNFDLIILEHGFNRCGFAIAHHYKAPVILFSATGFINQEEDIYGLPLESSWLPSFAEINIFTDRTFYDKLYNTLYRLFSYYHTKWISFPVLDSIVQEVLGPIPSIEEMEKTASLLFLNNHFANDYARSLSPFTVQVGGMHCKEKGSTLPKNLQDFIDGSEDGFVFISFGTIISMSKMPDELIEAIFDAVKNTKTRFLWKWDTDPPKNLPKNVLTAKWFPQQDLLAHPKIRAFVTHAGLMSVQQGVCHSVPMIVVPVVFDQPYNAHTVKRHGNGIHVEVSEMQFTFKTALHDILNDKKYAQNAKLIQQRFKDRPMTPLDTALYWTEYILRHGGDVTHLKPLGIHQSWVERRLLDVWGFIFAVLALVLVILVKLLKFLLKLCRNSKSDKSRSKVKKNN